MGVCESQKEKQKIDSEKSDDYSVKIDIKNLLNQMNQIEYILPEKLAKRDDVSKYYNIKQKILGEGASGIVCIGEKDGKKYAIKKINKIKIRNNAPFIQEADISLQIRHENIITYYEIFEDKEFISYVMDLGEGGDLFDFIVGCPLGHLPADIVIELLIQICDVVDYFLVLNHDEQYL